jgi:hypothetical protein
VSVIVTGIGAAEANATMIKKIGAIFVRRAFIHRTMLLRDANVNQLC